MKFPNLMKYLSVLFIILYSVWIEAYYFFYAKLEILFFLLNIFGQEFRWLWAKTDASDCSKTYQHAHLHHPQQRGPEQPPSWFCGRPHHHQAQLVGLSDLILIFSWRFFFCDILNWWVQKVGSFYWFMVVVDHTITKRNWWVGMVVVYLASIICF